MDVRSGKQRDLDELCPGLPKDFLWLDGWCSEQVFALHNGRDIFFADIEHHSMQQCKMPAVFPKASLGFLTSLPITRRGIFTVAENASPEGEMHILHYAPELAMAECTTLHDLAWSPARMEASEDGQWLLLKRNMPERGENLWYLVQLAEGVKPSLLISSDASEKALLPPSWHMSGFVPGDHQILVHNETELGLFDPGSHDLRRIAAAKASSVQIVSVELSPAGGFALVGLRASVRGSKTGGTVIVDLRNGTLDEPEHIGWQNTRWLGEDRLLLQEHSKAPQVINRDGTGARPLLTK